MMKPLRLFAYALWIFKEILLGTWDVLSNLPRKPYGNPMIVQLPLRCVTDFEITSMAQSITITPGTLVVATASGTSKTPPTLFVHSLFGDSEQEVLDGLYDMEDRLLKALRGEVPPRRSDQQ
ncbi:putative monovalent cation/H+ antiporter subunit E [Brevibacterium ravenspurgense]|uniref:Putative monovalent cation/H+ antiporter subunit E n=1 Tax=Brevibacterium ravenspurgense TaxID=479117 RepID=A0A150H8G1_9MICO|nr:putative monovalent cation/H+ antiporter subunit E [Brevibacterium ravenspurgense]